MYTLVLVRHGESTWNKENRFTGWTDVDLSEKGVQEAHAAGKILKDNLDTLHRLAAALLEREILDGSEIDAIIRGEELPPVERRNSTNTATPKEDAGPSAPPAMRPTEL